MKPVLRCNMEARHYAPNGMRRCARCLDRHGREGFAAFPPDEPAQRCDEPLHETTWAREHWRALASDGWRYVAPGFMRRGPIDIPIPKGERRIAHDASSEFEYAP